MPLISTRPRLNCRPTPLQPELQWTRQRSSDHVLRLCDTHRLRQELGSVLPAGHDRRRASLYFLAQEPAEVRRRQNIRGARGGSSVSKTEIDPVSGEQTTGHEWNGIKELDTPVPRGILWFIVVTHLFALVWWVLMPAFPLGWTYTKGILGIDQRETVEQVIVGNQRARQPWTSQIAALPFDQIQADEALMTNVAQSGRQLFGDNCAACHGLNGTGRSSYPDLTDGDWLWGDGSPETIAETMRVGINARHDETRMSQMPAFGRDAMLDRSDVRQVAQYVYSLSHPEYSTADNVDTIAAGQQLF